MIKTKKEHLTDIRNSVVRRLVEAAVNIEYWQIVFKTTKNNTQERVDVVNKLEINNVSIEKDEVFLKCIDDLLKK